MPQLWRDNDMDACNYFHTCTYDHSHCLSLANHSCSIYSMNLNYLHMYAEMMSNVSHPPHFWQDTGESGYETSYVTCACEFCLFCVRSPSALPTYYTTPNARSESFNLLADAAFTQPKLFACPTHSVGCSG